MLGFLFGPADPTKRWPPYDGRALTLDLSTGLLNEVSIGKPLEDLRFLGPIEEKKPLRNGVLSYPSLGLFVDIRETRVAGYSVNFDAKDKTASGFGGACFFNDARFTPATLTADNVASQLGEPYWRDSDEDETLVFYEFADHELQLEFRDSGTLTYAITTNEPLLSDAAQRQSYGVTAPWPPANL